MTSPSEEQEEEEINKERKTFWSSGDFLVLSRCFFMPHAVGMLFVMKQHKDEWYIVIKAYKFTGFEIFCIIIYCMSALSINIESTDCTICHFSVLLN